MAWPLARRTRGGVAGRRETVRPPAEVHRSAGRAGEGDRLHPAAEAGLPLSRWSCPELARHAVSDGVCASISPTTVRRWLSEDAIKPWQYRSWIFITDPDFEAKAQQVLDLYARTWDGKPLGPNDYVISADEKTSIQARCRCHPTLAPGAARAMRVNHDYDRGGAVAYLAAYDVHRGRVFGRCEDTTGIEPFSRLVEQVMTCEPYASAERVFWIVDNGSSHRGQAAIDRLAAQHPNAIMVHTPVHASWLNQIEIYFSIVQRKVVSPNDFTELDEGHRPPRLIRRALQPHRPPVQMEVHNHRPRQPAQQARQPPTQATETPFSRAQHDPRGTYGRDHLACRHRCDPGSSPMAGRDRVGGGGDGGGYRGLRRCCA